MTYDSEQDALGLAAALGVLANHQHARIDGGDPERPVALLSHGVRLESLKPILDSYLEHPERATGFDEVHDRDSFVAHVKRHAKPHSVVFATLKPGTPELLGIFDYHEPGTAGREGRPRHGQHGVRYPVELSEEYKAWHGFAVRGFVSPVEFAEFIEDRVMDVVAKPTESPALESLRETIGGSWATPAKLVELSRGLQLNVSETLKQASSLSSGEISVVYEAQHRDATGSQLKVPSLFAIGIPIFRGGDAYQVAVRLRYRVKEGKLVWAIAPYRLDRAWEHAFDELVDVVGTATQLPVFRGKAARS